MPDDATTIGSDSTGNSTESTAPEAGGSTSEAPDFFSALTEDNREIVGKKGWDSPDKVIESYRNLESKIGENLSVPGEDADQEAWDSFYAKLGRPENQEAYQFAMPEGLDENFQYDEQSVNEFKNWAYDAGLTPQQAQKIHDNFVGQMNDIYLSGVQAIEDTTSEAHKSLTKEWGGSEKSETYKRNVELANRAIRELGGEELEEAFKRVGFFRKDGAVLEPAIAKMLANIGSAEFAEDKLYSAEVRSQNPFSGEHRNLTKQAEVLRKDPELARSMIVGAGLKPESFGL